jgi:hypothetical protein
MATPAVALNPAIQTSAAGMFTIQSDGLVVGTAMPDPATRYALAGGYLASTETIPMYGGIAISENVPQETGLVPDVSLGGKIARATAYANVTGFSVFDQNYAAVNTPQSPCPAVGSGGLVNFYRLGSGARVALAIDPTLISLEGGLITAQVSWDFTNNKIIAFATTALPVKVLAVKATNCMVPVYTSGTGFTTWNYNGAAALCLL